MIGERGPVVKWTSFVLIFFVGAIKPMDQQINTVGLNFEEKLFFEPPWAHGLVRGTLKGHEGPSSLRGSLLAMGIFPNLCSYIP